MARADEAILAFAEKDYAAIRAALNDLNGVEAPKDDDENPMTPSAS